MPMLVPTPFIGTPKVVTIGPKFRQSSSQSCRDCREPTPMQSSPTRRPSTVTRALGRARCALLLAGCEANTAPAPKAERPVQVQRVAFAEARSPRESSAWCGRATRPTSASASPARSSPGWSMSATACAAGDVIARLDPEDLKLQLQSAEAELAAATSNLTQAAPISSATRRCGRAAMPRSPTSTARRRQTTRPKDGSIAPGARSTSRAISSAMPTSRPTPTA